MVDFLYSPTKIDDSIEGCAIFSTGYQLGFYSSSLYESLGIYVPMQLNNAVRKRKAEFLAGRYAAKKCIIELKGHVSSNTFKLDIGIDRAPVWPQGFIGSITHISDRASAIVARTDQYQAVGIDIELYVDTQEFIEICNQVLTSSECSILRNLDMSFGQLGTLVFSAKESLFKALYPLVKEYFDFMDAEVASLDIVSGTLKLKLLRTLGVSDTLQKGTQFDVKFCFCKTFVYTKLLLKK